MSSDGDGSVGSRRFELPDAELLDPERPFVEALESFNYEREECEAWRFSEVKRRESELTGTFWTVERSRSLKRWMLVGMTGLITALVGPCRPAPPARPPRLF